MSQRTLHEYSPGRYHTCVRSAAGDACDHIQPMDPPAPVTAGPTAETAPAAEPTPVDPDAGLMAEAEARLDDLRDAGASPEVLALFESALAAIRARLACRRQLGT